MPETPLAHVRHRTPGRLRIAVDRRCPDAELERLAERIRALPGVETVEPRPLTRSVIVHHRDVLADGALAAVGIAPGPVPIAAARSAEDPIGATINGLKQLDAAVSGATEGRLDLWSLAFGGLVAGGVIQLARGQIAGPALALFGQAATLALARPLRNFIR